MSRRPQTLYGSTVLSNETRYKQNSFVRPIVDVLQELHVARVNLTAMNESRFIIDYCLQFKISKFE